MKYGIDVEQYHVSRVLKNYDPKDMYNHCDRDFNLECISRIYLQNYILCFEKVQDVLPCVRELRNRGVDIPEDKYEIAERNFMEKFHLEKLPDEVYCVAQERNPIREANYVFICNHGYIYVENFILCLEGTKEAIIEAVNEFRNRNIWIARNSNHE